MNEKKKGCLELIAAFTVFFIALNLMGIAHVSWWLLLWWLWVPILIIILAVI